MLEIGMGVTMSVGSDAYAYEIVEIKDDTHCMIRALDHKAIGDFGTNEWELVSNENNPLLEMKFTYGKWRVKECGRWSNPKYERVRIGKANYHYDHQF